jgi:hypothetical protein
MKEKISRFLFKAPKNTPGSPGHFFPYYPGNLHDHLFVSTIFLVEDSGAKKVPMLPGR